MKTELILRRLYGVQKPRRRFGGLRNIPRALARKIQRHATPLSMGILGVTIWGFAHIYYYNQLIDLEYNCQAAWAQVNAAEQRRNHIQRNLVRVLRYYAKYEEKVMTDVTDIRTNGEKKAEEPAPSSTDGTLGDLLGRLKIVAEQYPQLHLTNNAQQFGSAIVKLEEDISQLIMEYNRQVNLYTTVLNQFPARVFATALGFENYEFYVPEDPKVLEYKEVDL